MTAVATLTGALSRRMTVRGLQAYGEGGVTAHIRCGSHCVPQGRWQGLSGMQGKLARAVLGGWAGAIPPGTAPCGPALRPWVIAAVSRRRRPGRGTFGQIEDYDLRGALVHFFIGSAWVLALVPFRVTQSSFCIYAAFESRRAHGARSHGPESLKPLPGLDGS